LAAAADAPQAAPGAPNATGTAPAAKGAATPPAIPLPSIATAIATAATVATRTAAAVDLERKGAQGTPPAAAAPTAAAAPQINAPVLPLAPAPEAPRDTIKVTAGSTTPVVNPLLTEAYGALGAGNLDASQRIYNQVLRSDPGSIDALLGLAAIATQQGNADEASRRYVKVLELDPRNALAQAGLIGMLGRADPQSAETRVKQLIAREPSSAYLFFALGLTYVDQKRWPDAQQAFFQAHQLQPDNPDYAFNLAVALEHIGQPKPALDYYRRAVQLAAGKARINFSTVTAEERIGKLEKVVR
jgi:tetratricopeptide (TPR) repeat protein